MVLTYDMAPVKKTKAIGNYLTAEDTVVNVPITQVMVSGASDLERLSNYPPPTIATGLFNNLTGLTIFVPAESLEAYRTATNWSTYASQIQAEPS